MKKALSVLMIAVLILGSLTLTACGDKGMQFVLVRDVGSISDESTQELINSLICLDQCKLDSYICILTDAASGEVEIPAQYKGYNVVYVAAFEGACKDVTKLTLSENVLYLQNVCNFDGNNEALTSVTPVRKEMYLSDCFNFCTGLEDAAFEEVRSMKNCFNGCKKLTATASFADEVNEGGEKYTLESSYCDCPALENAELSYFDAFNGNFNNCDALAAVKVIGSNDISDSFDNCDALKDVTLDIGKYRIIDSFNHCGVLTNLKRTSGEIEGSFNQCASLTELSINHSVTDSFNDAAALTTLSLYGEKATNSFNNAKKLASLKTDITNYKESFNECTALKNIELEYRLKTVDASFKNCPVNVKKVVSKQQEREEREAQKMDLHDEDIENLLPAALKKLAKKGIIPKYDEDEDSHALEFDSSDHLVFNDSSAEEKLYNAPDLSKGTVWIKAQGEVTDSSSGWKEKISDRFAEYFDKCDYFIYYGGFMASRDYDFYVSADNPDPSKTVDRIHLTTLVFVVDGHTGEIIHIHDCGTDYTGETVYVNPSISGVYGKVLYEEAEEYILGLLT